MRKATSLALAACCLAAASKATTIQTQTVIFNPAQLSTAGYGYMTLASLLPPSATNRDLTRIQFHGQWGQFGFKKTTPVDWSRYNGYAVTVHNEENFPISLGFRMTTSTSSYPYTQASLDLAAGQKAKFFIDFTDHDPSAMGMLYGPPVWPYPYLRVPVTVVSQNMNTVYQFQVFSRETSPVKIGISVVHGLEVTNDDYYNLVDSFGQSTRANWIGKVFGTADLQAQSSQEAADLAANPGPGETSGSNTLPNQGPSSRWRIAKLPSGKHYFVHPSGKLFWSFGMVSVGTISPTIVQDRGQLFNWLPGSGHPFEQFYSTYNGKTTYDFYAQNLYRKYGSNFKPLAQERANARHRSWGMNTLGVGFEYEMYNYDLPYVQIATTDEFPTRLPTPFAFWRQLPDPYASNFQSWMVSAWSPMMALHNGKKNFAGLYVDAEQAWADFGSPNEVYQLPLATLNRPMTQPAKAAFISQLKARYGTIVGFNAAWGTTFPTWAALELPVDLFTLTLQPNAIEDCSNFLRNYAATYYSKVRAALTQLNCTGLYLGSKNVLFWTPDEVFDAADQHVDVHSATVYLRDYNVPWHRFERLNKPTMIAEFSFGSRDRGMFAGGFVDDMESESQADRVNRARAYLDTALSKPYMVGAHWYTYIDQPLVGRPQNGENMAIGAVTVADTPYKELIGMFRSFSNGMYDRRGQ